jgi:hypothetical protein
LRWSEIFERGQFPVFNTLRRTFRELELDGLIREINGKQQDLDAREKNLIRREEILSQRMESQEGVNEISSPVASKEDLQADRSRDSHNWWTYVWHAKRQLVPLSEVEDSTRSLLDSQGVEIVTLRQVFLSRHFLSFLGIGAHPRLSQGIRIAETTSGGS